MELRRHLADFSGTSVASIAATGCDAAIYTLLVLFFVRHGALNVGIAASIAAVVGGAVHYSLCRFWVFRRFQASLTRSLILYLAMSWMAAVGHGFLTNWITQFAGLAGGWLLSKGIFWVFWTYPLSRYVIFWTRRE